MTVSPAPAAKVIATKKKVTVNAVQALKRICIVPSAREMILKTAKVKRVRWRVH